MTPDVNKTLVSFCYLVNFYHNLFLKSSENNIYKKF